MLSVVDLNVIMPRIALFIVMSSVIVLNVTILRVVMLNVVVPLKDPSVNAD